jgi:large subunit ribosomal protein L21
MSTAVALVIGLIIGWLVEWVIDWFYWRRAHPEPAQKPTDISAITSAQKTVRSKTPPANPDNLTVIKGIGPVIAKRLNQAGIYMYEQLADLTLDEFEEALGNLLERFINERSILRQARELANKKKEG